MKKSLAISEVVRGRGNPLGWRGDVESGEREGEEKKTGPPGEDVHTYECITLSTLIESLILRLKLGIELTLSKVLEVVE